jgi:hypothetical protein
VLRIIPNFSARLRLAGAWNVAVGGKRSKKRAYDACSVEGLKLFDLETIDIQAQEAMKLMVCTVLSFGNSGLNAAVLQSAVSICTVRAR